MKNLNISGTTFEVVDDKARNDVNQLKDDLYNFNCASIVFNKVNKTHNGITYTWNDDNCHITGTATALSFNNLIQSIDKLPYGFDTGETVHIKFSTTDTKIQIYVYFYVDGTMQPSIRITSNSELLIPDNVTGIIVRLNVSSGKTVNGVCTVSITKGIPNSEIIVPKGILDNADVNTIVDNGVWLLADSKIYDNLPENESNTGFLTVVTTGGWTYQEFSVFSNAHVYKRRGKNDNWSVWYLTGNGDVINYNNEYYFNEYNNSYNVSATPSITSDTNNFLSSTNDMTDVTQSIITMLTQSGVCHLGSGVFYVSGIDMPDDTMLIGCGSSTKVILLGTDTTEGYAIKMGSRCTIKDLSIMGNTEDHTLNTWYPSNSEYIQRHGILWQGNASGDNNNIPRRGVISGCYISNFTGGGITCYDSGLSTISGINVSDCWIWYCYAGVNINYYSEFTRWSNISVNSCLYGAINNGGNQTFVNCGFSRNIIGMLMDNSASQSPNNSHGSVCNCVFDHSDNNVGIGIKLLGLGNGELFSNCQLFYSSIVIDNCKGILLSNFDYGRSTSDDASGTISVTNNSFVIFDKFMCRTVPPVTVDDSSTAKFINCYTWTGTEILNS